MVEIIRIVYTEIIKKIILTNNICLGLCTSFTIERLQTRHCQHNSKHIRDGLGEPVIGQVDLHNLREVAEVVDATREAVLPQAAAASQTGRP